MNSPTNLGMGKITGGVLTSTHLYQDVISPSHFLTDALGIELDMSVSGFFSLLRKLLGILKRVTHAVISQNFWDWGNVAQW